MTSKERQRKFESYGSAYETLINDLKRFPREMWQFRPATDHRSNHDIIVHIANSEVESYILCGRLLAKFAYALPDFDDIKRIYDSGKHSQSIDEALTSIKKLRLTTNSLIKILPDVTWLPQVDPTKPNAIQRDRWLNIFERQIHIPCRYMHRPSPRRQSR